MFTIEEDSLYLRSRVIGDYDKLYSRCQKLQNMKNDYAVCEDSDKVRGCCKNQQNAGEYY